MKIEVWFLTTMATFHFVVDTDIGAVLVNNRVFSDWVRRMNGLDESVRRVMAQTAHQEITRSRDHRQDVSSCKVVC